MLLFALTLILGSKKMTFFLVLSVIFFWFCRLLLDYVLIDAGFGVLHVSDSYRRKKLHVRLLRDVWLFCFHAMRCPGKSGEVV